MSKLSGRLAVGFKEGAFLYDQFGRDDCSRDPALAVDLDFFRGLNVSDEFPIDDDVVH